MKKLILILSLFLSLNNYGFNGLLNRIYGWSLRDFIFSLFLKKENKDFSMLQTEKSSTGSCSVESLQKKMNVSLKKEEKDISPEDIFIEYNITLLDSKFNAQFEERNHEQKKQECLANLEAYKKLPPVEKKNAQEFSRLDRKIFFTEEFRKIYLYLDTFIKDKSNSQNVFEKTRAHKIGNILYSKDPDLSKIYHLLSGDAQKDLIEFFAMYPAKKLLEYCQECGYIKKNFK